jgi:Ricin-type beta-trefoil lectin domain
MFFFKIRSMADPAFCVDTLGIDKNPIGIHPCRGKPALASGNQRFELAYHKDITHFITKCMHVESNEAMAPIFLADCTSKQGKQLWRFDAVKTST